MKITYNIYYDIDVDNDGQKDVDFNFKQIKINERASIKLASFDNNTKYIEVNVIGCLSKNSIYNNTNIDINYEAKFIIKLNLQPIAKKQYEITVTYQDIYDYDVIKSNIEDNSKVHTTLSILDTIAAKIDNYEIFATFELNQI